MTLENNKTVTQREHPIRLQAIDHVVIRVQNLDQMTKFYCDVLGCQLERGPGEVKLTQLRAGQALIDRKCILVACWWSASGVAHIKFAIAAKSHFPPEVVFAADASGGFVRTAAIW